MGPEHIKVIKVINSAELARRLAVKESWVVEASKRSRTNDPIPCIRLGKHRRYLWNSPELLSHKDVDFSFIESAGKSKGTQQRQGRPGASVYFADGFIVQLLQEPTSRSSSQSAILGIVPPLPPGFRLWRSAIAAMSSVRIGNPWVQPSSLP
jgi:hypothetical protein